MRSMAELMEKVDLYVGNGEDMDISNLTGHPTAVLPDGFAENDGRETPNSIAFTGRLYDESTVMAVAHAYQRSTGHHLKRPPLERYLAEEASSNKAPGL